MHRRIHYDYLKPANSGDGPVNPASSDGASTAYEMVVGLEVHVQLKTMTKAFCSCSAAYGAPPNTNVCPVCLALPGALPVLNERAVDLAMRAALALGCSVHPVSIFARKHYFYPDLPKGYQISQYDRPLATGGSLAIGDRTVRITRVHLEEDAGKSIHDRYPDGTAIDLNRAGVPLIEIVSEPDLRSPADAGRYLRTLKQTMEYVGVSDVNMEEGSLRVDANVSARARGTTALGTKTEVKNLNSFTYVERALAAEFERQCKVLARGERVAQQTMLWDAAHGVVRPARSKEESHDYRYFPEPDLPPLEVEPTRITAARDALPELPAARRARYAASYGLTAAEIEPLVDKLRVGEYFESLVTEHGDAKTSANWVLTEVLAYLNAHNLDIARFPLTSAALAGLLGLVRDGTVSHSAAKTVFAEMVQSGEGAAGVAKRLGVTQVGDDGALERWIDEVLAENPTEARRFLGGERKLVGPLVGQVMKKSQGRADPKRVNQLLAKRLGS
jgi:aspartyl-tRNA(Asn)/glutamyl-tRNA(Gln) amidotransferase subunit B